MTTGRTNDWSELTGVTTWTAAYDYVHDRYQAYYAAGLGAALAEVGAALDVRPLHRMPRALRALRRVRSSYRLAGLMRRGGGRALDGVAGLLAGRRVPSSGRFHPLVGQYDFTFRGGRTVRLVVDAQDSGHLADEELLGRCEVYAKTNFRPDHSYPHKVVPSANGNPLVLPHIPLLRSLRHRPPEYDICFVVRVWGGRDEEAGVEHNLRLLEEVNRAPGRKFLLGYLVAGDVAAHERRLRKHGIPTTRSPLPLRQLWEVSAASRVNVIRLGMHNCVPWRFMDMLAMGACVVLDQPPQTAWPAPLVPGTHYLDLGAVTPPEGGTAADYGSVPAEIERVLGDERAEREVRGAAADYFDRHACPVAVGRELLACVARAAR